MATDSDLPIDIHCSKLLDWLVSRRHCGKDWQKGVVQVRAKILAAIRDMPEDERIVRLLQGSYIDYGHCVQIVQILTETEKDSKNFLGFYSSQRMKDWQEIVSLYLRGNLHLAEWAQLLQRLVQYELPAVKRQIAKADQTAMECARKETDYARQAGDAERVWTRTCATMGIAGHALRRELLALASDLPLFLREIASRLATLLPALAYYEAFVAHQSLNVAITPLIHAIVKRGNELTVFEWQRGYAPRAVEKPAIGGERDSGQEEPANQGDIDFGEGDIDFGIEDVSFEETSAFDGQMAILDENTGAFVQFEIERDTVGDCDDHVARGELAWSVLEHPEGMRTLLAELHEVKTFLHFRLLEETSESAADVYLAALEDTPTHIIRVKSAEIAGWMKQIDALLAAMKDPQKMHLFKMRSSSQYLDGLVADLEKKKGMEQRYRDMQQLMRAQKEEADKSGKDMTEELTRVLETARRIQTQLEEEIAKKYNGRKVNIMGGAIA